MLNPADINPLALPSVPLEDRLQLPTVPCIYFAIDSQGTVQYIGQTKNPRNRWAQHHRHDQLEGMGGVRIAYVQVDTDLLEAVEAALIQWFNPPLNKHGSGPLKRLSVSLPSSVYERLQAIAEAEGCSMSSVVGSLLEPTFAKHHVDLVRRLKSLRSIPD